ncbi:MAG: hypothetical protein ACE5FW_02435 [Candidatus Aenigmatarchaeota archaeon]
MRLADEVKVAVVGAVCVLGLGLVARDVLGVRLDLVSQSGPALVLVAYLVSRQRKCGGWVYWSLAIALVTLAIIALYSM